MSTVRLYDRDMREPVFEYLESTMGKVRILEEIVIGKSRADAVMVSETELCGIEIKSDMDTYARLKSQVKNYNKWFDRNLIVVGGTHGGHVEEHVPAWWGILSVEQVGDIFDFYWIREMKPNPKSVLKQKLHLLWRPELSQIQELYGMHRYTQKSKRFVQEKILEKLAEEQLHSAISAALFERDYTLIQEQIQQFKEEHA